jgi:hypothetical protein
MASLCRVRVSKVQVSRRTVYQTASLVFSSLHYCRHLLCRSSQWGGLVIRVT